MSGTDPDEEVSDDGREHDGKAPRRGRHRIADLTHLWAVITPPVVPLIEKTELPDAGGRTGPVLRVEIPRGFFVHRSPGGYLQRGGTSKRLMEIAIRARLCEQRRGSGGGQCDVQVVEDATLDDMDPRLVDRFRAESGGYAADPAAGDSA